MTSSRIKSIDKINPFNGRNGQIFYFTLTFENGDTGEIGKRSHDAFKVGDTVNYELQPAFSKNGNPYNRINEIRPETSSADFGHGGNREHRPVASFALAWAKDCIVAKIGTGTPYEGLEEMKTEIFDLAEEFLGWMRLKEAVQQ